MIEVKNGKDMAEQFYVMRLRSIQANVGKLWKKNIKGRLVLGPKSSPGSDECCRILG